MLRARWLEQAGRSFVKASDDLVISGWWLIMAGKYHAWCSTHSGSYPAGWGDHCHVSKVLVLLCCSCAFQSAEEWSTKSRATWCWRVTPTTPDVSGPYRWTVPSRWSSGRTLEVRPDQIELYAWPKTNSETKERCPRYSGSDGSDGNFDII